MVSSLGGRSGRSGPFLIHGPGQLIAAMQSQVIEAGTASNVTLRSEPKAVSRTMRAKFLAKGRRPDLRRLHVAVSPQRRCRTLAKAGCCCQATLQRTFDAMSTSSGMCQQPMFTEACRYRCSRLPSAGPIGTIRDALVSENNRHLRPRSK